MGDQGHYIKNTGLGPKAWVRALLLSLIGCVNLVKNFIFLSFNVLIYKVWIKQYLFHRASRGLKDLMDIKN